MDTTSFDRGNFFDMALATFAADLAIVLPTEIGVNDEIEGTFIVLAIFPTGEPAIEPCIFFIDFAKLSTIPPLPPPPLITINITSGGETTILDRVYNMSRCVIPGFFIGYSIQAVQLTLRNNKTILYSQFIKGKGVIEKDKTVNQIHGVRRGIHPLWERDYKYPPTLVYKELLELSGLTVKTMINLRVNSGSYTVETTKVTSYP